jgi:hypothetical protein
MGKISPKSFENDVFNAITDTSNFTAFKHPIRSFYHKNLYKRLGSH